MQEIVKLNIILMILRFLIINLENSLKIEFEFGTIAVCFLLSNSKSNVTQYYKRRG